MLLGFIPEIGPSIGWLDDLLIFRADYRCIHDHLAGTQVVEKSWAQPEQSQS